MSTELCKTHACEQSCVSEQREEGRGSKLSPKQYRAPCHPPAWLHEGEGLGLWCLPYILSNEHWRLPALFTTLCDVGTVRLGNARLDLPLLEAPRLALVDFLGQVSMRTCQETS
jgi:hypothetical protein